MEAATTRASASSAVEGAAGSSRWLILAALGIAQFMLIIDLTVLNVALPSIARDLGLDRTTLTWVATIYTLYFGALLLLGGRLADTFGRRRIFLTGLAIFTFASLASGLAPSGATLIAARIGQGIGAAMLSPAALSIITTTFVGRDRVQALAIWGALGGAGAVVGVILGGLLTAGPGWPWVFFINVPVGTAVAAAVAHVVPRDRPAATARRSLDLPGALTITATIGLLLFGLIGAGEAGWTSIQTLASIGLALVAGAVFVLIERRASAPLLPMRTFARPHLAGSLHILIVFAALLGGATFLGSLYAQRALGMSALDTGLTFVPFAIAVIIGAQGGAHAIGHLGPRRLAALGLALAALGAALLSQVPTGGDVLTDVLPGFVLMALGLGATAVAANTSAFTGVTEVDAGVTSGLVNVSHELGFAVGFSVLSTIAGASLAADPSIVGGYQSGFLAAAVAAAAVALLAYRVLPSEAPGGAGGHFGH
jgi:EmrB/QacA subfamily drug resistance transporter